MRRLSLLALALVVAACPPRPAPVRPAPTPPVLADAAPPAPPAAHAPVAPVPLAEYYQVVELDRVIAGKVSPGGTARVRVDEQLVWARAAVDDVRGAVTDLEAVDR